MIPQALQRLQQTQGRPMPMSQYQQPQGMPQQAPRIPAMAPQQPMQGMQPQGGQQGMSPQGQYNGPKMPPRGKEILSEDEYAQLIRDNYASGLDWGENAMMMRTMGANFQEGTKLDKLFKQLYDLDYKE